MRKIYLTLAFLILSGFVLAGCETQREQVIIDNWGKSFQAIKTNHIINPNAGLDEQTVEGMDGVDAEKALNKYHTSFDEKPPAPVTNISISGIGGK
jgi:hypothetical protein